MTVLEEFYKRFRIDKKEIYIGKKKEQLCNHCDDNCFGCDNKEYKYIYPPITLQVERELEELIFANDYALCTVPNSDGLGDDYYCWFDTTNMNRNMVSRATRQEALLSLCIKLADELGEEFITQVKGLIK